MVKKYRHNKIWLHISIHYNPQDSPIAFTNGLCVVHLNAVLYQQTQLAMPAAWKTLCQQVRAKSHLTIATSHQRRSWLTGMLDHFIVEGAR